MSTFFVGACSYTAYCPLYVPSAYNALATMAGPQGSTHVSCMPLYAYCMYHRILDAPCLISQALAFVIIGWLLHIIHVSDIQSTIKHKGSVALAVVCLPRVCICSRGVHTKFRIAYTTIRTALCQQWLPSASAKHTTYVYASGHCVEVAK